jgi:ribosomal protein L31
MSNPSAEQLFEFGVQCAKWLKRADSRALQVAISSRDHPFWTDLNRHFGQESLTDLTTRQIKEWTTLYASLGITLNPAEVAIPPHPEGFDRLIIVPKGMTPQKAYDLCAEKFPCWKYTDESLDIAVPTHDRTADNGPYAIWIMDTVEADEVHEDKSADMLTQQGIKGITLTERLLLELKYFTQAGKHLDIKNWTLCSGSRGCDGYVPNVCWRGGKLKVGWCSVGDRNGNLRSRAVVSL